jgi:hypothetical protein
MHRRIYIVLISLGFPLAAGSQEIVTGLLVNREVSRNWEKSDMRKSSMSSDTLEIPFFDDFSGSTVYPDINNWDDKYVFINNSFSVRQRSLGIATFDALDQAGRLYESAATTGFEADHLTSQPINLGYTAADDVWLSFFYEPGGVADPPEDKDSLTLQFYAPLESKWYSIWCSPSSPADTFKPVILSIDNPKFLKKGFRFRFINYASLGNTSGDPAMAGNCDQWNLDYILLGKNRNNADTIPADVAFTKPVRTILKTYESMPWKQFREVFLSEMGPRITVNYLNNDQITRNVTRKFEVFDVYKNSVAHSFSAGATNIPPAERIEYKASLIYTFNTDNPDSALFRVKSMLTTDIFDPKGNDTIVYYQRFGNDFSYDDGTAEGGYGINGLGSRNAMVAVKFKSFITDTLRAVMICFNDSYENSNLRTFDLMAWDDNGGKPGNEIMVQEEMTVVQGAGNNGFHTYVLNDPKGLSGDFYVGWRQRSETFLNAGFDLNTPAGGRLFYWLNGEWSVSQQPGSVMIRPLFGPKISPTAVEPVNESLNNQLMLFPNPAADYVIIDIGYYPVSGPVIVRITDLQGRELIKSEYTGRLDVSPLAPGLYFVTVSVSGKPAGYARLLKTQRR